MSGVTPWRVSPGAARSLPPVTPLSLAQLSVAQLLCPQMTVHPTVLAACFTVTLY